MHEPRPSSTLPHSQPGPPRTTAVALLFIACLAVFTAGQTFGQEPSTAPGTADAATEQASAVGDPSGGPSAAEPPPELRSPRAAMRCFLEAFDPNKRPPGVTPLERAAMALDLSGLGADVRDRQGQVLAEQLKEILDRTALIDISTIPDAPDGGPWRMAVGAEGGDGEVVIAADPQGFWRFDGATVRAIPDLLRAVRGNEKVEGIQDAGPLTLASWFRSKLPEGLQGVTFLLETWQWLGLLILVLIGLVVDRLVKGAVQLAIERYLDRRTERIDAAELRQALRPVGLLAASLFWWPTLFWLGLPNQVLQVLAVAVKFVAASAFVWAAYRMVDILAAVLALRAERTANRSDDLLVPLVRTALKIAVAAVGFVFIADNLDVEITSLVAGLGLGGLAFALAAQDTVKNLFGSLTVILDKPFAVGDWVVIGDVEGTITELGFRSTRIRTFYNSMVTLPNSHLISAAVDNYGERQYRRWKTYLGLTYGTPADKVDAFCEGVRELIRQHPYSRKDAFEVHLNRFSASSIDILVYMFFDCPDWSVELQSRHRLALDIMRLAQDLGVEFAFPTQTLFLQRPGDPPKPPAVESYGEHLDGVYADARERARRLSQAPRA
ncbi:MAG: mechanosensitive ion channel family protein [Acidobacteriota bacterium]